MESIVYGFNKKIELNMAMIAAIHKDSRYQQLQDSSEAYNQAVGRSGLTPNGDGIKEICLTFFERIGINPSDSLKQQMYTELYALAGSMMNVYKKYTFV